MKFEIRNGKVKIENGGESTGLSQSFHMPKTGTSFFLPNKIHHQSFFFELSFLPQTEREFNKEKEERYALLAAGGDHFRRWCCWGDMMLDAGRWSREQRSIWKELWHRKYNLPTTFDQCQEAYDYLTRDPTSNMKEPRWLMHGEWKMVWKRIG